MTREEAIEWLEVMKETAIFEQYEALKMAIEALQAEAVQGEWEDREVFNETDDDYFVEEWQSARCSVCGKYHTTPYMYYFDDFNYCPNCGAKMTPYKGGDSE